MIIRKFIKILFFLFGCILVGIVITETLDMFDKYKAKNNINKKIDVIKKENDILRKEIRLLEDKDSFYVNLLARKKLGMIGNGERIYKFKNK